VAAARGRPEGGGPGRPGRVYKLENGNPLAVQVRLGLSDGLRSEVLEGLSEGDKIIAGGAGSDTSGQQQRRRGPF
jgi:hypothetical protein